MNLKEWNRSKCRHGEDWRKSAEWVTYEEMLAMISKERVHNKIYKGNALDTCYRRLAAKNGYRNKVGVKEKKRKTQTDAAA